MGDDTPTGRWMTYDEIAATRGIKRTGAVRLVQRQKWRRQAGNDGYARILVPHDELHPVRGTKNRDDHPHQGGGNGGGDVAATFAAALEAVRESHAAEVAGLRERLAETTARADRAEAELAAERARADPLRDRLTAMQEQLADAYAALQAASEADARAAQDAAALSTERERAAALQAGLTEAEEVATRAVAELKDAQEAAEALGEQARELRAGQELLGGTHANELAAVRQQIEALRLQLAARQEVVDAAEATRQANDARLARGRWARLRAAWRGE